MRSFLKKIGLIASTTAEASLNVPHGTAPISPVDGDVWTTSAGLYARINGITVGPMGVGGSGGRSVGAKLYLANNYGGF